MIEISLLRHVKVDGDAALYGHTDVAPKSKLNRDLLAVLDRRQQVTPYDLVVSSPLKRCKVLAEQFSKNSKVPLTIISELKEMNFGDFDGAPFEEINQNRKQDWQLLEAFWQKPNEITLPNGESLAEFNYRVTTAWLALVNQMISNKKSKKEPFKVLLITHGGVIRMILSYILQLDWRHPALQQHLNIANASCSGISISQPFNDKKRTHTVINSIGLPMLSTLY